MDFYPVQTRDLERKSWSLPEGVIKKVYEVYCHLYGPQEAMMDLEKGCRGGFHVMEVVAFLYAASFPKELWREKSDEAFRAKSAIK
ncbi:hypothetical protein [Solidesulfovibrio fructosivorans]|uniref:hypothetical protein n=1 Tax=Solidesulfovibrio fructosivorans TaxID=878 RepID=UPI0005C15A18|nr:hypothetical protein [Solidesulfovibrio fructosivorans]